MNKTILAGLLLAGVVGAAGYGFGVRQGADHRRQADALPAIAPAARTFVCPMHPHIAQGHPGECPICGMDLVAMQDASGAEARQIHVDAATQQKLGVRLARAEVVTLTHDIATHATLVPDERAVLRITPNVEGLLTRLHLHQIGQRVARGEPMFELSSQEALALQYEYLDIRRRAQPAQQMVDERRAQNRALIEQARLSNDAAELERAERGARDSEEQLDAILRPMARDRERLALRLKQIGFTDAMLEDLLKTGKAHATVAVRAPHDCVVQAVMVRPGMSVDAMTEIVQCVDPSTAQLEIALYPDQLGWVAAGDAVTLRFADGSTLKTRLGPLPPLLDEATRTLRVRMPLAGTHSPLLGEFAQVTLHTAPREVLAVPKSAVI
ncbi:MAG: efflux RND transporter periplasmic adaptor subunit, partial [Pseudomonadota bacterium]